MKISRRQVNFNVDERVYKTLTKLGAEHGLQPTAYGKALFEAAYAVRCGAHTEPDLTASIKRVLVLRGAGEKIKDIAEATGLSKTTVEQTLLAWENEMRGLH
jgi:hypothetical protein